jgi:hypothetical protein
MKEGIFQFHIALTDSKPLIWRRFQVYNGITFCELHYVIQAVMGWRNDHLYEFRFKKYTILMPETDTSPMDKSIQMYGNEVCLFEMLTRPGQKFNYIYDFGDDWKHDIVFEKRLPMDESQNYPLCIDGENACPPEDSGGIRQFLQELANHQDKAGKIFPAGYDPAHFNTGETNKRLKPMSIAEIDQRMLFEDMVDQYLEMVYKPFALADCLEYLGIPGTQANEIEIHELIITNGDIVFDKDRYYPKVHFLKDFAIRITPTEFEMENGLLIPGHRLLPFLPIYMMADEAKFFFKNRSLEIINISLSVYELDTYFGLIDTSELPIINAVPHPDGEHQVSLFAIDLSDFYQENNFDYDDSIILEPRDLSSGTFNVRCDPAANIQAHKKEIKTWDCFFIESLKKVLRKGIEINYLEKQILYTYFYMNQVMTRKQKKLPGTEVGVLLRRTREVTYSELYDTGKMLHFGDQVVVNLTHKDS